MDVSEVRDKMDELNKKIAELLDCFEEETGVYVTSIGFDRRPVCDKLGRETGREYVVGVNVEL